MSAQMNSRENQEQFRMPNITTFPEIVLEVVASVLTHERKERL